MMMEMTANRQRKALPPKTLSDYDNGDDDQEEEEEKKEDDDDGGGNKYKETEKHAASRSIVQL